METIQYKCPNCGGGLKYRADKQKFACEFCLSEFTDKEIKQIFQSNENTDLSQNIDEPAQDEEFCAGNLYSCSSCGAEIMADANTAATFCVYCHNPVMLKGRLSGDYCPSKVMPFAIDRDTALSSFKKAMAKRKFLPGNFMTDKTLEKMTGLYVPFWLADCKANADMSAVGKKIRSWTQGNYRYTNTKEYAVERSASIKYRGIPADGASKIDDQLMDAVEPFDYSKLQDFSMSYLSGFLADRYDVDKGQVFPRIRDKVNNGSEEILKESISGYTSLNVSYFNTTIMNTDWSYALLPVWFMTYKYNDKMYEFAVNGQSGKTVGLPPLSVKKLVVFGIFLFIILTFLFGMGGYFFL